MAMTKILILLKKNYKNQYFDITFNMNRTSYQLQHRAIDYLEKHDLHPVLINNIKYDSFEYDYEDELVGMPENLAAETSKNLNTEQKTAVQNIISSSSPLPYILFDPAGK